MEYSCVARIYSGFWLSIGYQGGSKDVGGSLEHRRILALSPRLSDQLDRDLGGQLLQRAVRRSVLAVGRARHGG